MRLGLGRARLGNLYREISDEPATATVDAAWDAGLHHHLRHSGGYDRLDTPGVHSPRRARWR